jgi:hypothetical protein
MSREEHKWLLYFHKSTKILKDVEIRSFDFLRGVKEISG